MYIGSNCRFSQAVFPEMFQLFTFILDAHPFLPHTPSPKPPSAMGALSLLCSPPSQLYQSLYIHHIKENISWSSLLSPSVSS